MSFGLRTLWVAVLAAGLPLTTLFAQSAPPQEAIETPHAATLVYADGGVEVTRDGIQEPAAPPALLTDGDRIATDGVGRAEIVFSDGTVLHLDRDTALELLAPDRLRLAYGRLALRTSAVPAAEYSIDTPLAIATLRLGGRGEFGAIADDGRGVSISVSRGVAEIDDGRARRAVRAGEMAVIEQGGESVRFLPFNTARWDAFDRWTRDRIEGYGRAAGARHLPVELRPYGAVLDRHGRWEYRSTYGYVWVPASTPSWRPYYNGRWRLTRHGWTWHGHDAWAWPTHHYGRWGFEFGVWFWIPGRTWGPAWVSWAYGPGYVGWCPLGWNNRPIVSLSVRMGSPYGDPWRLWTVLPRRYFGGRDPVHRWAVASGDLPERDRRAFVTQREAPGRDVGVPRGTVSVPTAEATRASRSDVRRPGAVRSPAARPIGERPAAAAAPRGARGDSNRPDREAAAPSSGIIDMPWTAPAPGAIERRAGLPAGGRAGRDEIGEVTPEPSATARGREERRGWRRAPRATADDGGAGRSTLDAPRVAPPPAVGRADDGRAETARPRAEPARRDGPVRRSAPPPEASAPSGAEGGLADRGGSRRGGERRRPPG
ncbi:MAG: DUF6600 domain-containing protein [Acidobacteriota bacterium]